MFPSDLISGILSGLGCACIDRPTAPKAIRPLPESLLTMRPAQPHLRARRHSSGANSMLDSHNLQARHAPAAGHATIPSIAVLARSCSWGRGKPATGHGGRSDIGEFVRPTWNAQNAPVPLSACRAPRCSFASRPTPHECITASRCSSQHTAGMHQQPGSSLLGRAKSPRHYQRQSATVYDV